MRNCSYTTHTRVTSRYTRFLCVQMYCDICCDTKVGDARQEVKSLDINVKVSVENSDV